MAVPGFQAFFTPFLKRIGDGREHSMSDLYEQLADDMDLSDEDRLETVKSGLQTAYHNRISWTSTYFKKAGIIESPGRGLVKITERGRQVLAEAPPKLNIKYLRRFPEFVEFSKPISKTVNTPADAVDTNETPQDTLERAHSTLQKQLADDLLERILQSSPSFFERLVVDLLLKMGYGGSREDAGRIIGKAGDGGIDGTISEDRLGLDVIYIQAKRWESTVGRPVVQAFAGSLEGARAKKGVLISTSCFTPDAQSYVRQIEKKIVLIDGPLLANLMIEHNVGVSVEAAYEVKKVDLDYFGE